MLILNCKKCGYSSKEADVQAKIDIKTIPHNPKQEVAVIDKQTEAKVSVEPTIQAECPAAGT